MVQTRRTTLSREQLHGMLSLAFERIRPLGCGACAMPMPIHLPDPGYDAPNWGIPLVARCERDCASFMRWLAAQYGRIYELGDE